jgi:hypothetical protein
MGKRNRSQIPLVVGRCASIFELRKAPGECIEPFEKMGRLDLVQAIRNRIKRYQDRLHGRGWRNVIRLWDKKLTRGLLTQSARRVLRHVRTLQGKLDT